MKTENLICNYLVLAHANFEVLDKLIEALNAADVNFYIHVDKKMPRTYTSTKPNVHVLKDRHVVNWAGFGMVSATLALLKTAFKTSQWCVVRFVERRRLPHSAARNAGNLLQNLT